MLQRINVDGAISNEVPTPLRLPLTSRLRSIRHSRCTEHAPVTFDFRRRTERLSIIVGELHSWPPFNVGHFAD
jgi:hypothetical protein